MSYTEMNFASGGASSAEKVSYNNTMSGLSADNVQGAIDEISTPQMEDVRNLFDSSLVNTSLSDFRATLTRLGCLRILAIRDCKFISNGTGNVTFMQLNEGDVKGVTSAISVATNDAFGTAVAPAFVRPNGTVAMAGPKTTPAYEMFTIWTVSN